MYADLNDVHKTICDIVHLAGHMMIACKEHKSKTSITITIKHMKHLHDNIVV